MTPQESIACLITLGWSEARIAAEIGTSQPTIHRIKHGSQPRGASFNTCTALISFAEREIAKQGTTIEDNRNAAAA